MISKVFTKYRLKTYITAKCILSTAQNANKKTAGPINPILVISLLTDKTDHLFCTRLSAQCPATVRNN